MYKNNQKKSEKITKKTSLTTEQIVNMGNISNVTLGYHGNFSESNRPTRWD